MGNKVSARGIVFNYEDQGQEANLILIHGLGDNCKMWWNQMIPAYSKYWRVIAYDVRGSGGTDRPKDGYAIDDLVQDQKEWWLLAQSSIGADLETHDQMVWLNTRPVIMGYSMGGRIALEYACKFPKEVRALILVGSGVGLPRPASPEAQKRREEMMALLQKNDMKKWAEMMTVNAFSPGFREKNKKDFERYMKVKMEQKADGVLHLMQGMSGATTPPDLTKLTMPVLIIVGQNDLNMGPEQGKQAQAAVPGSKLVVLPTGHASPIEAPQQFNEVVLEFLREVRATTPAEKL